MTPIARYLYNDEAFWEKRLEEQVAYLDGIRIASEVKPSNRLLELEASASAVLDTINSRLNEIRRSEAMRPAPRGHI